MVKKYFLLLILFSFLCLLAVNSVPVSATVSCEDCTADSQCICSISDCDAGLLRIYSSGDCSDIANSVIVFSDGTALWSPSLSGTFQAMAFCDNGNISSCDEVNASIVEITTTTTTSTTTTTKTKTTTTSQKSSCPAAYDCCVGDASYLNRYCPLDNYECIDNQCVLITTTSSSTATVSNPQINYSLIGEVAIVIILIVFAYYFFKGRQPKDRWTELYKKYRR